METYWHVISRAPSAEGAVEYKLSRRSRGEGDLHARVSGSAGWLVSEVLWAMSVGVRDGSTGFVTVHAMIKFCVRTFGTDINQPGCVRNPGLLKYAQSIRSVTTEIHLLSMLPNSSS